jgi:hypothetical protein
MWTIPAVLNRKGLWRCCNAVVLQVLLVAGSAIIAEAQTTVGGHMGFVLPLVTDTDGQVTNLADNFGIGFPVGITVKGTGHFAFDMEFVPFINDSPRQVSLTLHPGGLWSIGHGFTVGMRAAFVVNSTEFGFTPLLNKSWPITREGSFFKAYFVEADLPVRFNRPVSGPATNPVQFAMHFGLGF